MFFEDTPYANVCRMEKKLGKLNPNARSLENASYNVGPPSDV